MESMQVFPCSVMVQSFSLDQIRKMIGRPLAIMGSCAHQTFIDLSLKRDSIVTTPMAPELGLFLEECFNTADNEKFRHSHEEVTQKGYEGLIQRFKHDVVYPHIAATEARDGTMALWLYSLDDRHYPYFVTRRESTKVMEPSG